MIKNILQVPLFLLIFVSYLYLVPNVLKLPQLLVGLVLGMVKKWRGKDPSAKFWGTYTRLEGFYGTLVTLVVIVAFFWFHLETTWWLKVWEDPLLVAAALVGFVYTAANLQSYNPVLRNIASSSLYTPWFVLLLTFVGFLFPDYIRPATFRYGVAAGLFVSLVFNLLLTRQMASDIQSFESLEERHNKLGAALKKLQHVAFLIGDGENWRTIREAIDNVESQYALTMTALRNKQFLEADNLIIQAENEVSHVERTFQDRIRFSLGDELTARLELAKNEVRGLQDEFEVAGLSASSVKQLSDQIPPLAAALNALDPTADDLLDRIEPFERLFREIVDTRTALRFRQAFGDIEIGLPNEIETKSLITYVARNIGLASEEAENKQIDLETKLTAFRTGPIKNARDLIISYQSVQSALTNFRSAIALLESALNYRWNQQLLEPDRVTAYVPKTCATDIATRGAIIVQFGSPRGKEVSVEMDSVLLELQADRTMAINPLADKTYGAGIFSFVGKRGGRGNLRVALKDGRGTPANFSVIVRPSLAEMIRDAVVLGAPIGGVITLVLWYLLKYELKDAGQIGVALGAASGLIIFGIKYLRNRTST